MLRKFVIWWFNIYTLEKFERNIDGDLMLHHLAILQKLQRKGQFDYDKKILVMDKENIKEYRRLIQEKYRPRHNTQLTFRGYNIVEKLNGDRH